jgi:hypothetical protein
MSTPPNILAIGDISFASPERKNNGGGPEYPGPAAMEERA